MSELSPVLNTAAKIFSLLDGYLPMQLVMQAIHSQKQASDIKLRHLI